MMKSNNVLTYLLYLLLAGLVVAAAFKACQIKKEKQLEKEKQEAELQQALRDMGYNSSDTTASVGSSYAAENSGAVAGNTSTPPKTGRQANPSGIEDEPVTTANTTAKTTTPSTTTAKSGAALSAKEKTVVALPKVTPQVQATEPTAKSATKRTIAAAPKKAKYRVQAGSFSKMEGARRRLEEVIKLGYPNAEIAKINNGKFAVVIVFRTNSKEEAIRVADKLEQKGVDAAVMENR
ncbi:MAG: SPOR domain-containing protein [Saprospiraceae bacterium]|nr:SPOR domain-containing protein [Saprospiraceae bacterium]